MVCAREHRCVEDRGLAATAATVSCLAWVLATELRPSVLSHLSSLSRHPESLCGAGGSHLVLGKCSTQPLTKVEKKCCFHPTKLTRKQTRK